MTRDTNFATCVQVGIAALARCVSLPLTPQWLRMGPHIATTYETNGTVAPEEVIALLRHGGFPRPLDDPERVQQMLDNGSFHITVRDTGELVGFVRVLTDYAYYGLVAEVAVAPSHKGRGIGKEMLRMARATATPKVTLILASSEEGAPFYAHLGWEHQGRGYRLRRSV